MKLILFFCFTLFVSQSIAGDTIKISRDLYLLKLSEETYIHVSWHSDAEWGKFTSNGVIVSKNGKAALFDTPMTDSLTRKLVNFIQDSLNCKIDYFIPNHFHSDCTAGMEILDSIGAVTISSEKTKEISVAKKILTADKTFSDTFLIHLEGKLIELKYPGPAHTNDNIVVWIADEKILFGGCMIRAKKSTSSGNIADANITEWPNTIKKLKTDYSDAKIVIPGHGDYGGKELFNHTIKLVTRKPKGK